MNENLAEETPSIAESASPAVEACLPENTGSPTQPAEAAGQNSAGPLPADIRQRLLQQFESWLDRMQQGEAPPDGLPAELLSETMASSADSATANQSSDLYSLFSALTTLTGEIRLQGRAFKQLTDTLAPVQMVPGKIDTLLSAQAKSAQALSSIVSAIDQLQASDDEQSDQALPPAKEVLAVLFDLYDRLERNTQTVQHSIESLHEAAPAGWRRWFSNGDTIRQIDSIAQAINQGNAMLLSRLDAALSQWEIHRVGEVGELFDPLTMMAVEVAPGPAQEDGRVLQVHRSGYAHHDQVLVTAQVKVGRSKA